MEQVDEARKKAKKYITIADRMLTQTFAMLQDPKLLIAVIENIFLAVANEISALMHYEKAIKKIRDVDEDFNKLIEKFKERSEKLGLKEYNAFITEIKKLRYGHKKADVEFSRKEMYVICSDDYDDCKVVSEEKLKSFIKTAKMFIQKAEEPILKNEGLFG